MSDARYDTYQHYGTNAERLAFVPNPPSLTGVQPIYIWYETDTLTTWVYSTSWVQITGAGTGAPVGSTYLTETNETANLPNSRRVLAGTNVTFDDTVANVRTINVNLTGIQVASVILTDAQIKALPTTPFTVIAAPGAGFYYDLLSVSIRVNTSAGSYTNIDTGTDPTNLPSLQLQSGAGIWLTSNISNDANSVSWFDGVSPLTMLTDLMGTAGVRLVQLVPVYSDSFLNGWGLITYPQGLVFIENQTVDISLANAVLGNLTGGNAANTMKVNVTYVKVAV